MPRTKKSLQVEKETDRVFVASRRRTLKAEKRHWAWLSYLESYYRFKGMKNLLKQVRVP